MGYYCSQENHVRPKTGGTVKLSLFWSILPFISLWLVACVYACVHEGHMRTRTLTRVHLHDGTALRPRGHEHQGEMNNPYLATEPEQTELLKNVKEQIVDMRGVQKLMTVSVKKETPSFSAWA